MKRILILGTVLLALAAAATAKASLPQGDMICGNCDGGYSCQWVENEGGGYYGSVTVHMHYCLDLTGDVWDVYGYATHSNPCCEPAIRWEGYQYVYQGGGASFYAKGQFAISVPIQGIWITVFYDYPTAGICADGYGNWWGC